MPFGPVDPGPLLDLVVRSRADAVLLSLVGRDLVAFNREFARAGLDHRVVRLSGALEENGLYALGGDATGELYACMPSFAAADDGVDERQLALQERHARRSGPDAPVVCAYARGVYDGVRLAAALAGGRLLATAPHRPAACPRRRPRLPGVDRNALRLNRYFHMEAVGSTLHPPGRAPAARCRSRHERAPHHPRPRRPDGHAPVPARRRETPASRRSATSQELKRSLSFTDLLVYGLIFMVPIAPFGIFGSVFQASGGMVALVYVDRWAGDGLHRGVLLADVARLPDGRLGLHLRGPRHRPAGRLHRRLDDPARLRARARPCCT